MNKSNVLYFDGPRMVTQEVAALACYERTSDNNYRHVGIARTPADALAWVRGEEVPLIVIHPSFYEVEKF